jgi:predicted nucleic acid-binding protein
MIFFDTGAWIALSVPGDRNAAQAKRLYNEVARRVHGAIVTTDFVLDETATFVRMATDAETAARLLHGILERPSGTLIWVDSGHFRAALEMLERHQDRRWSFTDCTSFVIMRELGITKAFSFDRNFEEAGFERLP